MSLPRGAKRLTPKALRWRCPAGAVRQALRDLPADPPRDAKELGRRRVDPQPQLPPERIVGQERAMAALQVALGSEAPGFHAFVCGWPGSGRRALVRAALAAVQPPFGRPTDRLYVADFERPDRPRLLTLPRGKGRKFRRDLDDVLAVLRRAIPLALNEDDFVRRCERVRRKHDAQAGKLLDDLASELRQGGLIVTGLPDPLATPELRIELPEGDPVPREVAQKKLDAKEVGAPVRRRLKAWPAAHERLVAVAAEARAASRRGLLGVRKREVARARQVAQGFLDDLAAAYPTDAVRRHLHAMLEALGDQIEPLLDDARDDDDGDTKKDDPLLRFRANLFVDAKAQPVPPVVYEGAPTLANLCGALDSGDEPAHLRLRAGSLALANHGVLVVEADELFDDAQTWRTVKRLLRSCWLEIPGATSGGRSLRPQPIRAALRVIVLGSEGLYDRLYHRDPEFRQLFQVKVQLEFDAPRTDPLIASYAQGLVGLAEAAGLRRPNAGATAFLLEHAARRAADQTRLALGFAPALNLLREADRLRGPGGGVLKRADVEQALAERRARADAEARRTLRDLERGDVLLETRGERVGVVNALLVYDQGEHSFARPGRVSAAVGVGREGVVDIEREVDFSGETHHKAVQILSGLFRERFAQDVPLCFTATLCFEQSYGPIDGDSASVAEVVALYSALSGLPVRQGWGITGSLNQKGQVQPVGAVNHKIEGYFESCRAQGLTGEQGVILPRANVRDLMLRADVIEAVRTKRFQVVAVDSLDQALALLLGVSAKTARERVEATLRRYAETWREFAGPV